MKRKRNDTLAVSIMLAGVLAFAGCTPGQRGAANTALDISQTLCILAHQAWPDSKVAEVCGITQPFIQPMRDVLTSARKEVASARAEAAGACK